MLEGLSRGKATPGMENILSRGIGEGSQFDARDKYIEIYSRMNICQTKES